MHLAVWWRVRILEHLFSFHPAPFSFVNEFGGELFVGSESRMSKDAADPPF